MAIDLLKQAGPKTSLLLAPGLVKEAHPDVPIVTAARAI